MNDISKLIEEKKNDKTNLKDLVDAFYNSEEIQKYYRESKSENKKVEETNQEDFF